MSARPFQYQSGGIHLPGLALHLDPQRRQLGPERAFVSHAHSDHTGAHREVILSEPTSRLMRARLGGRRVEHVLAFDETRRFDGPGEPFQITLLPAGHILGSAMAFVEWAGGSLLYTGDFKLRPGLTAEPCDPRPARGCDMLIMETTYGRPHYCLPPCAEVMDDLIRFCRQAMAEGVTPVVLGYSLGKSQEILRALRDAGLPILLHDAVEKLTRIYEHFGQTFPPYGSLAAGGAAGKVIVCPPNVVKSLASSIAGGMRIAVVTGWAMDRSCRFRYGADAAFPFSDHADFPGLVEMVRQVAPRRVYTLHGFAADFAQSLRELGFDAQAISEDEQLWLPLGLAGVAR
jgi:Cft2 family RNA processing exonuclease